MLSQMVAAGALQSMILWGPPGSGKTTIALLLARTIRRIFRTIAAVSAGVAELREAVEEARRELEAGGRRTVVFIDEIHRWNRAQQDAILPHVESGLITLIGATTENPSFEVIAPLLSRTRACWCCSRSATRISRRSVRARSATPSAAWAPADSRSRTSAIAELVRFGAATRGARSTRWRLRPSSRTTAGATAITPEHVREAAQQKALLYDRAGEEHYNVISAFIKSMRGSDPDAALYWMTRMVEAGEDPLFIARRMVIFASEDIGNADPRALQIALAVKDAVDFVGMPEGVIPLAQGVTYLAGAPKSNASYRAMNAARDDAASSARCRCRCICATRRPPLMKKLGYGEDYRYPHDYEGALVEQNYLPDELGEKILLRTFRARIRNQDSRVSCPRARGAQPHVAAQARRQRRTGKKRTARAGLGPFPRFTKNQGQEIISCREPSPSAPWQR